MLCENCHSKDHGGRDFSGEFNSSETAFSKRIANIRYAIANGKRINFVYRKPEEDIHKQRTIKPTELINLDHHRDSGSTLCVRGYCELRKAERTFALKRMRGLKVI
jgi:predicted DNA-binding transcriptional regulator YafY